MFILTVIVFAFSNGNITSTSFTQEYLSKDSCQAAYTTLNSTKPDTVRLIATCTAK